MASLLSKDSYIQNLGRKVCMQQNTEPRKRKLAPKDGADEQTHPKKKKKPRKSSRRFAHERDTRSVPQIASLITSQAQTTAQGSFSAVDILRKRLQEKIRESRGQASRKGLSAEESEKRLQRRKQERERKKRKRKEMKMKASQSVDQEEEAEVKPTPQAKDKDPAPLVFNKVEVHDEPLNKVMRKKEKKEQVKGNITPLTGKNYKQLLSRLEMRNNKLEELREKDERKAQEMESKIKWTNVLYKAEGVKIKDDEGMLKKALKRKEKQREQRKKRWDGRIEHTAERMQKRQDKRQRNIQKKKTSKLNKKKNRARKKGRILPEDLNKA
ncbi:surfeit locus protein 6 [Spea bombifrons]|uniref:surfeit locus protein 6 n=1 Tax=Spea bombifrons TaxID=233779 RepID=UPI00234AC205|nr:surfeit locus protein 6 [Spea bombifrons]